MPDSTALDDISILRAALVGLQHQQLHIESKMAEIRRTLGIRAPRSTAAPASAAETPVKRTMSPAARRRIAAAQKKRWAAVRNASAAPAEAAPKKRRISAAGMKRIVEATKKRWAAVRAQKAAAEKKVEKPVARKKSVAKKKATTATAGEQSSAS